nr:hypothetical protein [Tanacetum cinerariifolium]
LRVYLRTYDLDKMVQAAISSTILGTIKRVNLKPKVPTKVVCAEHMELRKEILTLKSYKTEVVVNTCCWIIRGFGLASGRARLTCCVSTRRGRLQLCQSVISSMHVYWASVLVILVGIIHDIEQLMRGFLWCNGELKKGRAKVEWDDICLPEREGGLGLRSLKVFNLALMTTHVWNIDSNKQSLWLNKAPNIGNIANIQLTDQDDELQWRDSSGKIGSFLVKGAWEALRTQGLDVAWYNVVWFTHAIPRHSFHLWLVMRNSLKTQDLLRSWDVGPTVDLASLWCLLCDRQRDSHNHLFFKCKFSARVWSYVRNIANIQLTNQDDELQWRDSSGKIGSFLVKGAWEALRTRARVWSYVRNLAELENVPPILTDIVEILHVTGKPKSARSIIGRLMVAATTYYIRKERNSRLFNKVNRTPEEIRDMITVTIRLKLL